MDRDVLGQLVREQQVPLQRFLRYLGADDAVAQDLAQEVFLLAYRKGLPQAGAAGQSAWLRGVARNMLLAHLRKDRRQRQALAALVNQRAESFERQFLRGGDGEDYLLALRQCLQSLPKRAQLLVDMQYRQAQSRAQMAANAGLTEDGVKSAMRRIRSALAQCVNGKLAVGNGAGRQP